MIFYTFVDMKSGIDIFTELGERLHSFGTDIVTGRIVERACELNNWFTKDDILRSVSTISEKMLRHDSLERWFDGYELPVKEPRRVLVVMAGNIPLVGLFDLMCVVISGHRCLVKPATKDRVLMEYLISLLRDIEPQIDLYIYNEDEPVDAVIATGSDNANRFFRAKYGDIPSVLRGTRQSVAVLLGDETPRQLAALGDDIFAYSGLGCRNISMIFLPRGYDLRLEPYPVSVKYLNNYKQAKAIAQMMGMSFIDCGNALLVERDEFPTALSEISYCYYDSLDKVVLWLEKYDHKLQCVVSQSVLHSRCVALGQAQAPKLTDYPDDVDVMSFLQNIG